MEKIENYCHLIQEKVKEFDLDGAFEELNNLAEVIDERYKSSIIIITARYNRIKSESINSTVDPSVTDISYNQLMADLLQLLQTIDVQITLKENHEKIDELEIAVSKLGAKMSLSVEIVKERINRLGDCWTSMYIFENKLFKLVDKFISCFIKNADISEGLSAVYFSFQKNKNLDNLFALLSNAELILLLKKNELKEGQHESLLQEMKLIFKNYDDADFILEKNKFWLGYDIYNEARKYHDCYPRFLEQYENREYSGCLNCLKYQKDAKRSIEEIIKHFQEQIF